MVNHITLFSFLFLFIAQQASAQLTPDSIIINKEYMSLDEAFENPSAVYRLNLSEQAFQIPDSAWMQFTNLRYLSLKNDHLTEIPEGIGYVKTLQVLDLSGNDFVDLPLTFANLSKLKELYINDDRYFNLEGNIELLSTIPSLNSLHIENIGLNTLPENMHKLDHIEFLYINNNSFETVPSELNLLRNLQYVDLHDNTFILPTQTPNGQGFGFKIRF